MAGQETVLERVRTLVEPLLTTLGFELVELEYKREGRGWTLRFFLDKEGGITLDDCADASREIGMLLEIEDVIPTAYNLEVSSPGIDRPLKKPSDYERFRGKLIKIKTYERLDPDQRGHLRKTFVGVLLGLEDGRVRIEQNDKKGGVVAFALDEIAHAQLEFEF
jgi:ribosome maturation factor RimP